MTNRRSRMALDRRYKRNALLSSSSMAYSSTWKGFITDPKRAMTAISYNQVKQFGELINPW